MPPGPELSALLASIEPSTVTNGQMPGLVAAHYTQLCADYARLFAGDR